VAILFGDDVVVGKTPTIKQLIKVYEKYRDPVIAVERVDKKEVEKYGIVDAVKTEERTHQIHSLVEKPLPKDAPSNLAIIGKYIITPDVFEALAKAKPGVGGEIRLIDAFRSIVSHRSIYAYEFEGERFDCGSKLGFLKAMVYFGLNHKDLKKEFAKHLKKVKP
jgi:UTP--glucose-1-phosphate uridylyltransferase